MEIPPELCLELLMAADYLNGLLNLMSQPCAELHLSMGDETTNSLYTLQYEHCSLVRIPEMLLSGRGETVDLIIDDLHGDTDGCPK